MVRAKVPAKVPAKVLPTARFNIYFSLPLTALTQLTGLGSAGLGWAGLGCGCGSVVTLARFKKCVAECGG